MDLDISTDSDLEAAILEDLQPKQRQQRKFKKQSFGEVLGEVACQQQHRVPLEVVDYLEEVLTPLLQHPTKRNQPLTPRQQVKVLT
jgi:hypothetical protein